MAMDLANWLDSDSASIYHNNSWGHLNHHITVKGVAVKRTMEVSIMDQKFVIKSDSDDDYVNNVADYVDEKINEVIQNTKTVASLNVAILAAMNIADEFFKFKRDRKERFHTVEKKIEDLIELIDLQM